MKSQQEDPTAGQWLPVVLVEFMIIVLPVAFYISAEAFVKSDSSWLFRSPEWSIASIFLCFQGLKFYKELGPSRAIETLMSLLFLIFVVFTLYIVIAELNGLDKKWAQPQAINCVLKFLLFAIATFAFATLVGTATYLEKKKLSCQNET